jgi:hypothetical protein
MKRFVEGEDRRQGVLLPEFLDDYVSEENPVRAIDVFVDELDLGMLGFDLSGNRTFAGPRRNSATGSALVSIASSLSDIARDRNPKSSSIDLRRRLDHDFAPETLVETSKCRRGASAFASMARRE